MLYSNIKKYYKKEEIKIQRDLQTWRHSFSTCCLCAHHLPFFVPIIIIIIMYIHHHLIINTRHPTKESMTRREHSPSYHIHQLCQNKQKWSVSINWTSKVWLIQTIHDTYIHTYVHTWRSLRTTPKSHTMQNVLTFSFETKPNFIFIS